mgnify:CR=1 FL=1
MKYPDFDDVDDVGDAIREGRALREAAAYRIRFGLDGLTFRNINVPDPVPTGRQILASAGLDHRTDYILYAYLDTGDFEDVRLDETFDLCGKGAERFIAFKSDRDFKFSLNDRQLNEKPIHNELAYQIYLRMFMGPSVPEELRNRLLGLGA